MIIAWLLGCTPIVETVASHNPLSSIDRSIDRSPVVGTVSEAVEAGGYQYLLVDTQWYVSLTGGMQAGDAVTLKPIGRATPFRSARLDRTFPSMTFASVSLYQP